MTSQPAAAHHIRTVHLPTRCNSALHLANNYYLHEQAPVTCWECDRVGDIGTMLVVVRAPALKDGNLTRTGTDGCPARPVPAVTSVPPPPPAPADAAGR